MGRLVKKISAGIGLLSEALAKKPDKSQTSGPSNASDSAQSSQVNGAIGDGGPSRVAAPGEGYRAHDASNNEDHGVTGDEEERDRDELSSGDSLEQPVTEHSTQQRADAFLITHRVHLSTSTAKPQLPCPVIIPQRRPGDKKRGFIMAYAPLLEDFGIYQATFLEFLQIFHDSCQANPSLRVVNIAAVGAGLVPGPISKGLSAAMRISVGIAMEAQRRTKTSSFLDRMNLEFFQPLGLYCLIMTYKPESESTHTTINIIETIFFRDTPAATSNLRQTFDKLHISSGNTYGDLELPEAAPLIFPALDANALSNADKVPDQPGKLDKGRDFASNYLDRRAQATFAGQNPDGKLTNGPAEKFSNRYADPNSSTNSGSLTALLTGGKFDLRKRRTEKKNERREKFGREPKEQKERVGVVKRVLKKDVLYLMIVNMPSFEEILAVQASTQEAV